MTQLEQLRSAILEQVEQTIDIDLLDFVLKLLISER